MGIDFADNLNFSVPVDVVKGALTLIHAAGRLVFTWAQIREWKLDARARSFPENSSVAPRVARGGQPLAVVCC
ncbi:hypothetical protein GWI33_011147 [Rhynchophorus ferrugineus]|uniref:Uncharacterized protein n=1 Tax=Rhynchophorus ferrugineus TaxID=354439 RepID=A0A834IA55_RHYFE|nr:hypothetical protein GWI33_011147 [Rhynchophorus ferrugineus]